MIDNQCGDMTCNNIKQGVACKLIRTSLMRKYFIYVLIIFCFLLWSCKKNIDNRLYTISGKLLESSSNPVPVTNYKLTLVQNRKLGFLGSFEGIEQTVSTNNEGRFSFSYSLKSGTGVATGSTNPNPLYLTSYDTSQHKNLYPEFNPITVKVDTNFNAFFLYKKIDRVVRKVQFNIPLNSGESLEVITTGTFGAKYKTLTGPIAAGTLLVVDTLNNYKTSRLNLQSKTYTILSVLKKPSYQKDLNIELSLGDEDFREILMVY